MNPMCSKLSDPDYPEPNLIEVLRHDEDLVAVIRGHLYLEVQLNRLLAALLPYADEISDARLGWPQRINLALALGLKRQYRAPLKKVGAIRNGFAHEPGQTLKDGDVEALYDSLSQEDRNIVLESYERTQAQVPDPIGRPFLELNARERFTLILVTLHAMLVAAVSEVTSQVSGT